MKSLTQFIQESARFAKIDKLKKEIDLYNDKDQRGPANVGEALIHSLIKAFNEEGNGVLNVPSHNEMGEGMWLVYNPNFTDAIVWEPYRNNRFITWAIHLDRKEAIIQGQIIYTVSELDDQLIKNMNGDVKFVQIHC